MTRIDDSSEMIRRGDEFDHEQYGHIEVTDFERRVTGIGIGQDEFEIDVEFTTAPGESFVTEHQIKKEPKEAFLEAVWER